MDESTYRETLEELDRQIALTEEFLRQRKNLARHDTDLKSKLRAYKRERERLLRAGPTEQADPDITFR